MIRTALYSVNDRPPVPFWMDCPNKNAKAWDVRELNGHFLKPKNKRIPVEYMQTNKCQQSTYNEKCIVWFYINWNGMVTGDKESQTVKHIYA